MRSVKFVLFLSLLTAAACAEDHTPTPKTAAEVPQPAPVSVTEPTNAVMPQMQADQTVNVGPNLRALCAIDDINRAPKFEFDKSNLSSTDHDILSQVATCMTTGALQGRSISLVGRADPRGEAEYNMNLGEMRATSAKAYLEQLGVEPGRLQDTSRGALDARGHDEGTWAIDRRVDLEVK